MLDRGQDAGQVALHLGIPKHLVVQWLKEAGGSAGLHGIPGSSARSGRVGGPILGMRRSSLSRLQQNAKTTNGNGSSIDHDGAVADARAELEALRAENTELKRQIETLTATVLGFTEGLAARLNEQSGQARKFAQSLKKRRGP